MNKKVMLIMIIMIMALSFAACSDDKDSKEVQAKNASSDDAEKKEDPKQKYIDEIGKTQDGKRIVCYEKGEVYEMYAIAYFEDNKMIKTKEYRMYGDGEYNGKSYFETDMEYYKERSDLVDSNEELKIVVFEKAVREDDEVLTYDECYENKVNSDVTIIE